MTHEEKIAQWIGPGGIGVEIGPGISPVPGLDPRPFYVDCFKSFGAEPNLADYYGHAGALPFHDHSLDYVIASHVLEHVANPVAALAEWVRVVRPGGILYLVVPDRRVTWDHTRALTPVAHFLDDYTRGTTACDPTHIDEFAGGVDWSQFSPATPVDAIPAARASLALGMHEAVARGEEINIHFHTFEPSNLRGLLETLAVHHVPDPARWGRGALTARVGGPDAESGGVRAPRLPSSSTSSAASAPRLPVRFPWELVDFAEHFPAACPNGLLAVLRVTKGWLARAQADAFRRRTGADPRAALRPDAEPFATWAARTPGLGGVR
jgi:SAM-dependent methyltransferase